MSAKIYRVCCIVLCLFFISCKGKKEKVEQTEGFVLNDTMTKKIELSEVKLEEVVDELKLTGKIEYDQDKVVDVISFVSGRVNKVNIELGDFVTKGQSLATIFSADVAQAESTLITAQGNLATAQRKLEAANDMYKGGLISEKELIETKASLEIAQAELKRAKELGVLYGTKSQSIFDVKAPVSGYVVKKNVTENMEIKTDNSEPLFTICDLSDVWVMANVYETDIQKIKVGYEADIFTIAYPDSMMKGRIDKLFNVLDPENKVMKARITLNNPGYMLKPQMFAKVMLRFKEHKVIEAVPSIAVIFDKSRYYVMVYKDKSHIETREVKIYKSNSSKTYIQSGLKVGENVISKYQLLVYDAIND